MSSNALRNNPYFNGRAASGQYRPMPQYDQQGGFAQPAQYGQAPQPTQLPQQYGGRGQFSQPGYGQPGVPTPDQLNAQFNQPPATPDQMDRMSYEDTIAKTVGLFAALLVAAAVAWFVPLLMVVGAIGGLVLGLILAFKKEPAPGLVWAFAIAEGLLVGGFTSFLERIYPGIAMQAILATLSVVGVTLALFSFGKIRTSPRMTKIVLVAMLGYLVFSIANGIGMLLTPGSEMFGWRSSVDVFGIPLGVILGVFAVLMGAYMLVMDFEFIKNGVESGAPRKYGWIAGYSLISTVVYIYIEILRVIAILRGND